MANTKEQISCNMRSNKCKDTKPELPLRKELWRRGLRYRKNYKALEGKPDIVFLRAQIAVFVDGRMWHGYDWEHENDIKLLMFSLEQSHKGMTMNYCKKR